MSTDTLETAFERLCFQAAETQRSMRSIRDDANTRRRDLERQDNLREQRGKPHDYTVSHMNMSFRKAVDGKHFFYDFQSHSLAAEIQHLVRRTNRQYQWLLAEVYENFEDFMEHCYAAAAHADRSNWPHRDYGELRADEIAALPYEHLVRLAQSKKGKPRSLLNPLRRQIFLIQRFESSNSLDRNLWFTLNLSEQLRHHIVHTKGKIQSREDFSKKVLEGSGLFNNGRPERVYTEWIETYVRESEKGFEVNLLERPAKPIGPISTYHSIFDELFNSLLAYAHLVASSFVRLESVKPPAADADA